MTGWARQPMFDVESGAWTKDRKSTMRTNGLILRGLSLLVCVAPAAAQSRGRAPHWHGADQRLGVQRLGVQRNGVQRDDAQREVRPSRRASPRSVTWYSVFDGYSQAPQTGLPWKPDESSASIRSAARADRRAQRITARNSRRSSVARRSRLPYIERYARRSGLRDRRSERSWPDVRPLTPAAARRRDRGHAAEIRERPEPLTLRRMNPESHSVSPRPPRQRRSD